MAANPKLKFEGWLAIEGKNLDERRPHAAKASARLTVKKPSLAQNEIAIRIAVELPFSLFIKPTIQANICVDDSDAAPLELDLNVIDTIEEVLRDRTDLKIEIVQPEA